MILVRRIFLSGSLFFMFAGSIFQSISSAYFLLNIPRKIVVQYIVASLFIYATVIFSVVTVGVGDEFYIRSLIASFSLAYLFFCAMGFIKQKKFIPEDTYFYVIVFSALTLLGWHYLYLDATYSKRLGLLFVESPSAGAHLLGLICGVNLFLSNLFINDRTKFYIAIFVISFLGLLTSSRGFILFSIIFLFTNLVKNPRHIVYFIIMGLFFIVVNFYLEQDILFKRFFWDTSFDQRFMRIFDAFNYSAQKYFTPGVLEGRPGWFESSHLSILADFGIFGFSLVLLSMYGMLVRKKYLTCLVISTAMGISDFFYTPSGILIISLIFYLDDFVYQHSPP